MWFGRILLFDASNCFTIIELGNNNCSCSLVKSNLTWLELIFLKKWHTCQWVDTNASTHLLKVTSELWILLDFLFVFSCKIFKRWFEGIQLFSHLAKQKVIINCCKLMLWGLCLGRRRYPITCWFDRSPVFLKFSKKLLNCQSWFILLVIAGCLLFPFPL